MIPLLLWILSPHFPWQGPNGAQEILAAILFVLASITDGVDGYLARKRGLSYAQPARSAPVMLIFADGNEISQMAQLHSDTLSRSV